MREHLGAVLGEGDAEENGGIRLAAAGPRVLVDQRRQADAARLERFSAEIAAVELDDVEGNEGGV